MLLLFINIKYSLTNDSDFVFEFWTLHINIHIKEDNSGIDNSFLVSQMSTKWQIFAKSIKLFFDLTELQEDFMWGSWSIDLLKNILKRAQVSRTNKGTNWIKFTMPAKRVFFYYQFIMSAKKGGFFKINYQYYNFAFSAKDLILWEVNSDDLYHDPDPN